MAPTKRREVAVSTDDYDGDAIALSLKEGLIDVDLNLWRERAMSLLQSGWPIAFEKRLSDSDVAAARSEKRSAKARKLVCLRAKRESLRVALARVFELLRLSRDRAPSRLQLETLARVFELLRLSHEASSQRCSLNDGDVARDADLYAFSREVANG